MQYEIGVEYGKIGIGRYIQRNKKNNLYDSKSVFFFSFFLAMEKIVLGQGKMRVRKSGGVVHLRLR